MAALLPPRETAIGGGCETNAAQIRATAPVARSVFWVMIIVDGLGDLPGRACRRRGSAPAPGRTPPTTWSSLILLPALSAFAFTRLFLVLTQSNRGTLNVYSVISSPYAWMFWVGLAIGLCGYGIHTAAHSLYRAMPGILARGEFAAKIQFLDVRLGYVLLGFGFFLATIAIIFLGQGSRPSGCPAGERSALRSARSPPTAPSSSTWGSAAARSSARSRPAFVIVRDQPLDPALPVGGDSSTR